ncbi:Mu-like prophage major head subunit gpT family protein [Blastomonas sp.]|uniref:Mu-like prophage major head subunit gpT family protein n=1 Tax=Blastomonas sp. TaxID=1909299 RepID=UPI00180ACD80|nr:Mu-like prophage major head subunit gpT family protein [Blastomonas sp.]
MARVVTQALLDALRVTFSNAFEKGKTEAKIVGEFMSTPIPSTTAINTYGFLGDLPIFRKWVGEKRLKQVQEKAYQLLNEPYEATLPVHKHQIADDQIGLYPSMFEGWGKEGRQWMDRLRFQALALGHTLPCFDGQNLFDDEHPQYDEAGTTWSNSDTTAGGEAWFLLDCSQPLKPLISQEREAPHFWWINNLMDSKVAETGIFTAYGEARGAVGFTLPFLAYRSTRTLNAANYILARDAMKAFKDDNGEPRGIRPTHLVAGISNQQRAKDTFKATLTNGESNTLAGEVVIVEADRLP